MKKKRLESLKAMTKSQLVDSLLKKSIKGGCCSSTLALVDDDDIPETADYYLDDSNH